MISVIHDNKTYAAECEGSRDDYVVEKEKYTHDQPTSRNNLKALPFLSIIAFLRKKRNLLINKGN